MIKYLGMLGQVAMAAQPGVGIAAESNQLKQYNLNERVPSNLFSGVYDQSKEGYLKMISEGNAVFRDLNIDLTKAAIFYKEHPEKANVQIRNTMIQLGKRGFFSWIGHAFETVATAVADGLTFGQIPGMNEAVVDPASETADNAIGFWNDTTGILTKAGRGLLTLDSGMMYGVDKLMQSIGVQIPQETLNTIKNGANPDDLKALLLQFTDLTDPKTLESFTDIKDILDGLGL